MSIMACTRTATISARFVFPDDEDPDDENPDDEDPDDEDPTLWIFCLSAFSLADAI